MQHNVRIWRNIVGALELTRRYRMDFSPPEDYWYQTERRFLVAYFAKHFRDSYSPPDALRRLALSTFSHFGGARQKGRFGDPALASRHPSGWEGLKPILNRVAAEMPDLQEFHLLRERWPRIKGVSIGKHLQDFLEEISNAEDPLDEVELPFFQRLPWFPYLGIRGIEELLPRQKFFAGLYMVFASTNGRFAINRLPSSHGGLTDSGESPLLPQREADTRDEAQ